MNFGEWINQRELLLLREFADYDYDTPGAHARFMLINSDEYMKWLEQREADALNGFMTEKHRPLNSVNEMTSLRVAGALIMLKEYLKLHG